MTLGSFTVTPDIEPMTNDTAFPLGSVATYTCDEGMEYEDESLEKIAVCDIGGVWQPDLPNDDPCERELLTSVTLPA